MNKFVTTLIFPAIVSCSVLPALAQVDAIPDPHQDFYQMRQPKRTVQQPIPSDAADAKDVSDQNAIDLKSFHDQAPRVVSKKAAPGKEFTSAIKPVNSHNDLNDAMTDVMPQLAPDLKSGQNTTVDEQAVVPNAPAVTHPEVMSRPPIPTPPAVTLLPPMNGGRVKQDLAWRARAYKLRAEGTDVKNGLVKGSRVVYASFDDTLAAVTKVCPSANITIDSVFESAGQLLAHPSDAAPDKSSIIFSLKPLSHTSTLLRVGLDADNHSKQSSFEDLLNRIDTAANEKGLL